MFMNELEGVHEHLELKCNAFSRRKFVPFIRFPTESKNFELGP